ncbi:MAG TPA: amidohydrolase family protein [Candidatus Angelobacter sp.]|jgi:predicted TIM-barrel fold metal-dependent hydrolase
MDETDIFLDRRRLLKLLGIGTATSFLTGCWPFTRPVSHNCTVAPNIQSLLLTVDAHCHIFNGSDLQVKEFIGRIVGNEKGVPPVVSEAVGSLLEDLVWGGAPDGDEELHMLKKFHPCLDQSKNKALVRQHYERKYQVGRQALLRTKALNSSRLSGMQTLSGPFSTSLPANRDNVLAEIHKWLRQANSSEEYKTTRDRTFAAAHGDTSHIELFSAQNAVTQRAAAGGLDYVLENFQYRFTAMQDYLETYKQRDGSTVDLMLASMVDYDWWLAKGRRTSTPLKKQVEVMARISVVSNGRLHGFVPFDPLREVAYWAGKPPETSLGDEPMVFSSLELVKDAIENQGCVGVKLYPPMGFAPFQNKFRASEFWNREWLPSWMKEQIGSTRDNRMLPIGQRLDDVLGELYTWCCDNDVPLMAHSNASNGVIDEFKDLVDPKYWKAVLDCWPNLRISFGHLGGFSDPHNVGNANEPPERLIDLMSEEPNKPGANAYADVAYFTEVLSSDRTLGNRILAEYKKLSDGKPAILPHRLMYGTDWSLLINYGDVQPYLSHFISVLQDVDKVTQGHASEGFWDVMQLIGSDWSLECLREGASTTFTAKTAFNWKRIHQLGE